MTDTPPYFPHPEDMDSIGVDVSDLPPHDNTVDQYHCDGCHLRALREIDFVERTPINIQIEEVVDEFGVYHPPRFMTVIPDVDPNGFFPRWLAKWDEVHAT